MNSERLKLNRSRDKMFIPMNVEGGGYDEKFLNTTKILTIVSIAVTWIVVVTWLNSLQNATILFKFISLSVLFFITSLLVRFVIFEESYFYKMYKKTLTYKNPTSDVFWNISSIKDTPNGSILLFSDLKIGVLIKLKRGSIIGKNQDFREQHYDAVSDFLSEIVGRRYSFVHLNMMERADNDDRLDRLGLFIGQTTNPNMKRLLELQLGHLRNTTRNGLYESDYYLIYTDRADRLDSIMRDIEDCLEFVLDGSYTGYFELDKKETVDVHKELIGVSYFDYNNATVNTFREYQIDDNPAITLKKLNLANGSVIDLSKNDDAFLRKLASDIDANNYSDIAVLKKLTDNRNMDYRLRSNIDLEKYNKKEIKSNKNKEININLLDNIDLVSLETEEMTKNLSNSVHSIKKEEENIENLINSLSDEDDEEISL